MGVGPCAVSLARWYGVKERGTFYGIWSTAHNIGEAVTYMVIAAVIAGFGWQMGYLSTAALGAAGVVLLVLFMHDSPQSSGFPSINVIRDEPQEEAEARGSVFKNQLLALRNPALWTLALASAFMYIDRYAVNSWGSSFSSRIKPIPRWRRPGLSASTPSPASPGPSSPACSPTAFSTQPQRDGRVYQPAEHRRLRPDALVAAQLLH